MAERDPYVPGPAGPLIWVWIKAISYYVHVALATLVHGSIGLPRALIWGRAGAQAVATGWIAYMLRAARWHFGVRYEIRGTPPSGDVIVAAKHQSFLDILAIAQACPQRAFVMKKQIMRVPIMGWFARKVGSVPIDRTRGASARSAIVEAVRQAMPQGLGQLIIYPEGTRTRPGEKRPYKGGAGMLYSETGLPCQPVATNAGMFWPKEGIRIRPGIAVIEFLDPIPAGLPETELMERLPHVIEGASDALMARAGL
ncbi:MAG: lysophospholipid acyltransferase family protein [Paracoccus sp. (in: a-proteobacteria)]|uniref:lysophospholipid acyltransferase family protein n=1 Tax=Paracoccus sp. TaxID=267 RepID=UPI0026E0B49C|nr:lysophospholipid acyltransferase family protein [Paracoccus sp. (in: a-proteobacteria)]MDO5620029.1 lysophospholipid acyltransferase family protein [Paracoccus sp. (in: a-proteobacteria)]